MSERWVTLVRNKTSGAVHRDGCSSTYRRTSYAPWGSALLDIGRMGLGLKDHEVEGVVDWARQDDSHFCMRCLAYLEMTRRRIDRQGRAATTIGVSA